MANPVIIRSKNAKKRREKVVHKIGDRMPRIGPFKKI
jgi:hypothetical protein